MGQLFGYLFKHLRKTEVIELSVFIKRLTQKQLNCLSKYFCKGSHGAGRTFSFLTRGF